MNRFKLRFTAAKVEELSKAYSYPETDKTLRTELRPVVLERGFLTRTEFLQLCEWKTQRTKSRCAQNGEFVVRTVTRAAFATTDEALKMDLLRTLGGVEWPTASAILHFCDQRPYPILDYRALWSLGYDDPPHCTTEFWLDYLKLTRGMADRLGVDIRTLDRALWQYSKENQKK